MMEPFSAHGEIPTQTHASPSGHERRTHTRKLPGVKSLSSNLYDGLNNYSAFLAQFADEPAPYRPLVTFIRITLASRLNVISW